MPFDDYDGLQAEIADWLNRTDIPNQIKSFISLAEGYLSRQLRCEEQRSILPVSITSEYVPLPTTFRLAENVALTGNDGMEIEYVTPQVFVQKRSRYTPSGKPRYFTFVGRQMRFAPVPDSPYEAELDYYAGVTPLSVASPTNWLLEKYPDTYLYGSLLYANQFLKDIEATAIAAQSLADAIEGVRMETERAKVTTTAKVRFAAIG